LPPPHSGGRLGWGQAGRRGRDHARLRRAPPSQPSTRKGRNAPQAGEGAKEQHRLVFGSLAAGGRRNTQSAASPGSWLPRRRRESDLPTRSVAGPSAPAPQAGAGPPQPRRPPLLAPPPRGGGEGGGGGRQVAAPCPRAPPARAPIPAFHP